MQKLKTPTTATMQSHLVIAFTLRHNRFPRLYLIGIKNWAYFVLLVIIINSTN